MCVNDWENENFSLYVGVGMLSFMGLQGVVESGDVISLHVSLFLLIMCWYNPIIVLYR